MSDFEEYIAAGLLNVVSTDSAWLPEQLATLIEEKYDLSVDLEVITAASHILAECGIAFTEEDPFAGTFIKISRSRTSAFLALVNEERSPTYEGAKNDLHFSGAASSIFGGVRRPNLAKYEKFKILRRYHEFGSIFIVRALAEIASRGYEPGLTPASDRVVSPSDNQDAYDQSIVSLKEIEVKLKTDNEVGDLLGNSREIALQELSTLRSFIERAQVRVAPALLLAKKCLGWIVEKAGAASIGDLAKRALAQLIEWLTS